MNWKADFSSLPLNWSKIVWVSSCINEKQKLFSEHILPDTCAWLRAFEVNAAEIRFFAWVMYYSRTERGPLRIWLIVHKKANGTTCTVHFQGGEHSWISWEAHGEGYERCSSKTHSVNDFINCTDLLICLLVAFVPLTSKSMDLTYHNYFNPVNKWEINIHLIHFNQVNINPAGDSLSLNLKPHLIFSPSTIQV